MNSRKQLQQELRRVKRQYRKLRRAHNVAGDRITERAMRETASRLEELRYETREAS